MRGGPLSDVLKVEEDSLQEHSHTSTISDPGHTHGYTNWGGNGGADGTPDPMANPTGDVFYFNYPYHFQSDSAKSGISMSVTGVRGARKSSETKPKNMNVVFVMKVCWLKYKPNYFTKIMPLNAIFLRTSFLKPKY